jgi:hypothetical protein
MKKLMVAAVAATMASASMADISIKGDAYIQYADRGPLSTIFQLYRGGQFA